MRKLSKVVGFLEEDGEYSKQSLLKRYSHDIDEEENRPKLDIIREIIEQNDWDIAPRSNINGRNKAEVTLMILYEYSTGLEKLTGGKVSYKDVLKKLSLYMGKFRYGDWREEDSDCIYDNAPVTSEEFKKLNKDKFGAQAVTIEREGEPFKKALVLYDINEFGINNGINLRDINEIRHTMFHELTHIMEISRSLEDEEEFFELDNQGELGVKYRRFRNSKKESDGHVYYKGVSTEEFDELAEVYNGIGIMHNRVTEGFVENIARKILEGLGEKVKNKGRYYYPVKISQDIMDVYGEEDVITTFVTDSSKLIRELEGPEKGTDDFLHLASDRIMDANFDAVIPGKNPKTQIVERLVTRIISACRADKDLSYKDKSNREFFARRVVTIEEFHDFLDDMLKKPYSKKKVLNQKDKKELDFLFDEYYKALHDENEFFFDDEKGFKAMLAARLRKRNYENTEYSMTDLAKGALKVMTKNAIHSSKINQIRQGIQGKDKIPEDEVLDGQ